MNNKKVNQDTRKVNIAEREELESLIADNGNTLELLAKEAEKLVPKQQKFSFDHMTLNKTSIQEATDIVESNAKFYLTLDTITTEEYIQQKIRSDIVTMTTLIKDQKIAEYAIIKMIELIDEGVVKERTFEVLAGYQRSKLEITKTIAQYVVMMENNYKNIKEDCKNKRNESALDIVGEDVTDDNGDMVTKGTRSFMKNLRETIEEVNYDINNDLLKKSKEREQ